MKSKEIAVEILNGDLEVSDLTNDAQFLKDVDESIVNIVKKYDAWSDLSVAKKRRELMKKIEVVLSN